MRTTVTIDDDVASILKPLLENGKPKQVMNDLLRRALGIRTTDPVELRVFRPGLKPGIDPVSFNRLAQELELEDDLNRHRK